MEHKRLFFVLVGWIGCCLMANGQESYAWKNVAIGGGGFVSGIITSKTEQNLVYARTDVGGAYRWDATNGRWIPLLDWASENETGYLGVESIAIDPVATNKVYMLAGISYFNNGKTAILKSTDYGSTFTIVDVTAQFKEDGNGMGRQTGEKLVVDPNSTNILFCGTRSNGLFKSSNSGSTWSVVAGLTVPTTTNGSNGISFVTLDASTGSSGSATQTIIAGISTTGTNLYRSNNGGSTFTAITGGPTTLMPHRAALSSDRNLFITYVNAAGPWDITSSGQIWKYNLQTGAWTNVTPAAFPKPFGGISVDPNNPLRLVASSVNTYLTQGTSYGDRIFLSTNGGTSWTDVVARGFSLDDNNIDWINGNAIHWAGCVEFDPFDTKKAWIISGNGVFHTDDIDATINVWKFEVKGLEETVPLNLVSISNGPVVSVVGDYDGFRHTNVLEYGTIHSPRIGTTTGLAVAARDPNVMTRVGDKMYYSLDMGVNWTECSLIAKKGNMAISADGSIFMHCAEGSTKTYRSIDRGTSWVASTGISVSEARIVADPVRSNKFYAYYPNNGTILISVDGGASFSAAGTPGTNGSKIIRAVPEREGDLWVPLYSDGLTRSINSGQAFSKITSVTACSAVGFGRAAPDKTFPTVFIWGTVNSVTGLFRSIDEGSSWLRVNDNDHEYGGLGNGQFVSGDMNVFGRVYMSTAGRGIAFGESDQTCIPSMVNPHVTIDGGADQQTTMVTITTGSALTISPEPASGGSWNWTGPDGFASTDREVVVSNIQNEQMGEYRAVYTNADGCVSSTESISVNLPVVKATGIVVTAPGGSTAIDTQSGTLQLSAAFQPLTTTDQSVTWSVNAGNLASISDSGLLTAIGNGDVIARATANDGTNVFGELTIAITNQSLAVGIQDTGTEVSIYPNPCRGSFTIKTSNNIIKIEIIDVRGVVVFTTEFTSGENPIVRTGLNPGLYVGRISSQTDVSIKKIIIE